MTVAPASGPFVAGDRVQLTDRKGRMRTIVLVPGALAHSQNGTLPHDDLIGRPDGSVVTTADGTPLLALRPLLDDIVMSMPRGAAIIYPKDAAMILAKADIRPGVRVVEAGVGSGAMSLWLLRALAGTGRLTSFERRDEFAQIARGNVESVFGEPGNWDLVVGDLVEDLPRHCPDGDVDRVVLDMLAPWECIDAVASALVAGGVLLVYVATVTQLSRTVEAVRASGRFTEPHSDETMVRGWHVDGLAVRPDHRMVAHTGFLMTARTLAPGAVLPEKARKNKTSFTDSDVETWTPGAVGDRTPSAKVLRKRAREANRAASQTAVSDAPTDSSPERATESTTHTEGVEL